ALAQSLDVMARQHDLDAVVDVEPFRVMVELFGLQRDARHEGEGLAEIRKMEGLADGVAVLDLGPAVQFLKGETPRFAAQLSRHDHLLRIETSAAWRRRNRALS